MIMQMVTMMTAIMTVAMKMTHDFKGSSQSQ